MSFALCRRLLMAGLWLLALPGLWAQPDAAEEGHAAATVGTKTDEAEPLLRSETLRFSDAGISEVARLDGIASKLDVAFGIRGDEVVREARLLLTFASSPSLLEALSHLRVSLNGAVVGTHVLKKEQAGRETTVRFDIDPRAFTDFNRLRVDLVGHYTMECEDPSHSSIWATISPESRLELKLQPLPLANDLALLPAPFFDPRDGRRLELPVVLPGTLDLPIVRSAAVLASWFGALADYRGARFPVYREALPVADHAVVLLRNGESLGDWQPEPVTQPTISVVGHPEAPAYKLLLIRGRDTAQIDAAVGALTLGRLLLSGSQASVASYTPPQPRAAYDNPRWLPTDRPVRFGELVDDPSQLTVSGLRPDPIRINLRLAPDLFTWRREGIPIDLRYRYTAPAVRDNSQLAVSINGEFVQAIRLQSARLARDAREVDIPLIEQPRAGSADAFLLPAFRAGADNRMEYRFLLDSYRAGPCASASGFGRAAIDPDSTIDLTDFPNYTAMPELAHFANASFPFSRYGDLAQTVAVLPASPTVAEVEKLLFLVGRTGRHTGAVASRLRVMAPEALSEGLDADLLILDDGRGLDLLSRWESRMPVHLLGDERWLAPRPRAPWYLPDSLSEPPEPGHAEVGVRAEGPMAAMLAFESPLKSGRSAVVVASNEPGASGLLLDVLEDGGLVREVRGDLVLVRGRDVSSHRGAARYYVGHLTAWQHLLVFVARHPLLVVLLGLLGALLMAWVVHEALSRRARRRIEAA